ncbi:hypothetical protein K488DRAFT_45434 [Vararia minispora EC-137]|uniref:Uncharacterized protein n=1 Tax=Vararia minispora EC-137 TaxID=1314806 RepID=A0ACB8QRW7_9AGAM|nr:hypothetical protein K488DRAFT_45434 [Vararia minispora EC-137]
MFNAPRPTQAYGVASTTSFGGSFVDENPLVSSAYDPDPWSQAPSPAPAAVPQMFTSAIAEATAPAVYHLAFGAVDPTGAGETSVNSLSRVLATSGLSASTVDRIVNLVSSRPRVSKMEFFVALALASLAQSGRDISVELVAQLAQQNVLPEPTLDLSALSAPSTYSYPQPRQQTVYASDDPWHTSGFTTGDQQPTTLPVNVNGGGSSLAGNGLPKNWWMRQQKVTVNFAGQQGFLLSRYMLYQITTERGAPVSRRYSEFVFLWDCLVRRYPFRLLPQLPPKRLGPDETFLEQRRKGLQRFLNFVINHPVIKEDGLLGTFLTEPSFEQWRKHSTISLDEESNGKRIDRVEEMAIPSDLEDKLAFVRSKIIMFIDAWQKISILTERIIRKREAVAVRGPPAALTFGNPHLSLPSSSSSPFRSSLGSTSDTASVHTLPATFMSFLAPPVMVDAQADLSRMTNTLKALVEVQGQCWRGEDCELTEGVKVGMRRFADHTQVHTDMLEQRTQTLLNNTLESVKSQRDLYIAMRDLFIRHDRLSVDQVERLKKRIDVSSVKLDGIKATAKDGWEEEADKLVSAIEKDRVTIAAQLNRRVFIRACMWHELRVVLHNRENTLLTQAVQTFAREEAKYSDAVTQNWNALMEAVEPMPLE